MKDCTHCKHARWETTKSGRLHNSGYGLCAYPWKMPPLPASMYWPGIIQPKPCGGPINRNKELQDHCVYFSLLNSSLTVIAVVENTFNIKTNLFDGKAITMTASSDVTK